MTVTHESTKEMIAELRRMANRTGNKQAEKTMRDGAAWLEDVENIRIELQNENERLRQRIEDKDEQLAGWKALLDAKTADSDAKNPKRKRRTSRYDYAAALSGFMESGERAKLIPIIGRYSGGGIYPKTTVFKKYASEQKLPVDARSAGDYIILARTDNVAGDKP